MNYNYKGQEFTYVTDCRDQEEIRNGFFKLAKETFGLDFEPWYRGGFWSEAYVPHALMINGQMAANISVNLMTFRYGEEEKHYIQLGTIMTAKQYRHIGLGRFLMEQVLAEWQNKGECLYLRANDEVLDYYPRFGFEPQDQYRYSRIITKKDPGIEATHVDLTDKVWLDRLLSAYGQSNPFSLFSMPDNNNLLMFYCLYEIENQVYYIEPYHAFVVGEYRDDGFLCMDIFGSTQASMEEILSVMIKGDAGRVILGFTPKNRERYECKVLKEEDATLFILSGGENLSREDKLMFPMLSYT